MNTIRIPQGIFNGFIYKALKSNSCSKDANSTAEERQNTGVDRIYRVNSKGL